MKGISSLVIGDLLEYRAQNRWLVVLIILVNLLILFRFFQLQVLGGKKYEKLAEINQVRRTRIPSRRGEVLDRKGRVIAANIDLTRVAVVPHYVEDIDALLEKLQGVLLFTDKRKERVRERYFEYIQHKRKRFREITVKRFVNGRFCPEDGTRLEDAPVLHYLWCNKCGEQFVEIPRGQSQCPFDNAKLTMSTDGARGECPVCSRKFVFSGACPTDGSPLAGVEHHLHCSRCNRDYHDAAAVLHARLHEFPGVFLSDQAVRAYPYGELFAHAVGYVNEVTGEELKRHPGVYVPGNYVGRRGVEKALEEVLRGKAGEEVTFRDKKGRSLKVGDSSETLANLKYDPAVPGNSVVLTLDVETQKILREELKEAHSAGIIVMDARNGEVLGSFSTPSFDPNHWAGRLSAEKKKSYDENPFYPMINKAATAFPPASTFKVVTALGALNEGIITKDTRINCPGHYNYAGHRFGCYNKYGHGDMDLHRAFVVSCDVYFYRLGEWLGMDRLEHYSNLLGLGRRTGIAMGEDMGLVPSREWHERYSKGGFQPGFTLSTAVGQKDIRATPLQMAQVIAQVVNGGRLLQPYLVDRIVDPEGNMVRNMKKQPQGELGVPQEYLEFLKMAMNDTVEMEEGTAHNAALASIRMGGKTGTAEALQIKKGVDPFVRRWLAEDHAWFVGFAPAADPAIVVSLIVEHGGYGGAVAAPVVSAVIYKLFSRGLVPSMGEEE
jgi:penicillin-binding protein 2